MQLVPPVAAPSRPAEDSRADLLGSRSSQYRQPSSQPSYTQYGRGPPAPSGSSARVPPPQAGYPQQSRQQPQQSRSQPQGGYANYGNYESNRAELFKGAKPPRDDFGRGNLHDPDRYGSHGDQQAFDEDDEVYARSTCSKSRFTFRQRGH